MAKNLKPCITIINIDGKEARLTYDQMREHLFNNPELWQEGKAERRKIGGKKKEAKEGPLSSVEATAKALEGESFNYIKNSAKFILDFVGSVEDKNLNTNWGDWFLGENKDAKNRIAFDIQSNLKLRNALMSNLYDLWKKETKSNMPFEDFLNTEITVYRGGEKGSKNEIDVDGFNTWELTKEGAKKFAKGEDIVEKKIPVQNLYGAVDIVGGEIEVLEKTKISDVFAKEIFEQQQWLDLISENLNSNEIKQLTDLTKQKKFNEALSLSRRFISSAYHAAKKDGSNPELVKAVEDLLGEKAEGKQAAPNSPEGIAARIRNKKQRGALSAIDFGISVTVYNGALEFMASQVEKGTKLGNAIANTIKWIDDKMKGEKWNKGAFGKYMNDTYKVTLGDGREVEVVRDDSKETAEVVNGWYQPIEQKVLDSKEESLPANKWAERLKSKEDEDLWTGVRAFLEEKGTERVSRKELLDFIKDNRIEIVTVVKGEGYIVRDTKADKDIKEFDDYEEAVDFVLEQKKKGNDYSVLEKDKKKSVKFEQYQLPGDKENYKEVLVTLPKKLPIPDGNYIVYADKGAAERREYIKGFNTENEAYNWVKENKDKYPYTIDYETRKIVESIESGDVFKSSHFDEPNILVHLRMNTRTDADGNKVLFLEEVQSDWGQKGKKEGFVKKGWLVKDYFDQVIGSYETEQEARQAAKDVGGNVIKGRTGMAPTAPFVMDTNSWVKLGLKTALQEAVRQGADKIAWTTGEQQNDRYDLSKQINSASAIKNNDGTYNLIVEDKQGNEIDPYSRSGKKVTPSEMEDIVGKDLTQKLIEGADRNKGKEWKKNMPINPEFYTVSGIDLKVGGKGMKGFYGSAQEGSKGIIGGVAESLFGQKVGETKIKTSNLFAKETLEVVYRPNEPMGRVWLIEDNQGRVRGRYSSKEAAEQEIALLRKQRKDAISYATQSSISITPELKAQVEKGLPLFGTQLSPEQKLKQAIDEWKAENKKLGISVNWEKLAETDKKLIKALFNYIKEKIAQGKYSFDDFVREYGNKIKNFEAQKGKWQGLYNKAAKEAETEKPVTPTEEKKEEGRKPVRELPEGEEGETEKPVVGRAFRGTTDEALAEKLAKMGLYRKPASLEEAEKVGAETVALLGVDKAIELGAKGDVSNGLVRMGIFKAVLADLKKQRNNLVVKEGAQGQEEYIKALDEINDKRAEAMAAFSPSLTSAGQVLRGFQDIIRDEEFEFDYNSRKTKFKDLFGDEAYTKEVDDKFKEYDAKLKEAAQKRKELEDRIAELEAQSVVDDIGQQKKSMSFFKQAAERVRKLKLSRPGIFSTATPASLAWDAAIEGVALVLDASGTLEQAIVAGIGKLKQTEWYKSLTDSKKRNAEDELRKYVKDGYILKATIDDAGVIQVPTGLLRSYVTSGVNDVQAIIDDMLSYLKEADSEITAADVRTAILEAGKKEAPTQNQITQSVNDLKSMIRMLGQLEKIRAGERITKNEGKKRQMRDAVANLKKLIEQKHLEVFGTKPGALTDEQRLANLKKNAQQRIADMRAMKPRPEPRQKVKWDAEMEAIANEEYRVKEKWDEEFSKARIAQLSAWQKIGRGAYLGVNFSKTIMSGMTDLGNLLIQAATLPFRSASVTKQAIANMAKVILSHDEFVKQQRTINESDLYRIARKSGLDMPQVSGMEIDKLEESGLGVAGELIGDVLFLPFKYVPKAGPKMYEWAKKHINVPRVLNRMQTSYLNTLRYGAFSLSARNLMQKGITFQDNPQAYKDVAEAINTMSGRTKLGAENSPAIMRALNLMFYSPKNAASVAKLYTPLVLIEIGSKRADASGWMGMSEAQQTMIRTMAGATAIPAALYLILKAMTGWEEEDEEKKKREGNITLDIENPNSSAFMKIRIGNQLFDPWGGRAQIITLQSRLWIHWWGSGRGYKDPYTGIEKKLSEVQRFKHPVGLVQEYAKGKLSPYARALLTLGTYQAVKGKKWYVRQPTDGGPEFNAWDPIKESYTNITLESMADLYGNQPLTISEIMTLFLIAGGGVTTLNNQDDRSLISKIREKTAPEEDEKRKFAKNFGSYIKEGNVEGAEGVYDEAVGVTGKEKSKTEVIKKRREQADEFFNSAKKDGIAPRYSIDKEDRKKVFDLLYNNKPIPPTTKKDKKELYERMNSFTPEEKAAIMHDYDVEYQELMNIAKGLDALNKTPMKYERKAKSVEWVKEYRKAKGLK